MKLFVLRGIPAIAAASLLLVTGCATDPAPTPASQLVLPTPAVVEKYQWVNVKAPESPAWKLLERVVAATGGTAVVDGVTTLVSTGKMQMTSPGGAFEATVTTTFSFPDKLRREVVLPGGGTVSTTFTPARAWMTGPMGDVELPPWEKQQLEESAMRAPLSLLKARRHKLFRVAVGDPAERNGEPRETLLFRLAGETTEAVLDGDHRIVELSWEAAAPTREGTKRRVRLLYSDFRAVGGLVYPYSTEAFSGTEKDSSLRVESLRVNPPLPPGVFEPAAAGPAPSPAPSPRGAPGIP